MTGFAIALLVILLIIVVAVLVLLFSPITYAIDVNGRSPYKGEVLIKWLGRLFSAHVAYEEDKPFFKEVYILGKMRIGPVRDYEEWLAKRVSDEVEKTEIKDDEQEPQTYDEALKMEPKGPVVEKVTFTEDGDVEAIVCKADDDGTNGESPEKKVFTSLEDFKNDMLEKKRMVQEKIHDTLHPDSAIPFDWWLPYMKNPEFYQALMLFAKRASRHSMPNDFYVEGKFGLGDPYRTGIIAGGLNGFWPDKWNDVMFNYMEFEAEGSGYIKGRILPVVMAWYGTKLVLTKAVRDFLVAGMKVFLTKRKEAKQKQVKAAAASAAKDATD